MKNESKVVLKLFKHKISSPYLRNKNKEDAGQKTLSMTSCFTKGFTLIELLVVVLIIGILSAVALPQYTKAVAKARFAEALMNLKSLSEAVKLCELENGKLVWSSNDTCGAVENLSISIGSIPNSGSNCFETENFWYCTDRGNLDFENTVAVAQYKKEDVCICIHDDGTFAASNQSDCSLKEPSYDPAKLLNLTDSVCSCC